MTAPTKPPGERPPSADWKQLHLWQIQPIRDALLIAGVLGLVYLGSRLSVVTVPLLLALTLAYLFEPLVAWCERVTRLRRSILAMAVVVITGVVVVVPVTLGVGFASIQGVKLAQRLYRNADALTGAMQHPEDPESKQRLAGGGKSWAELYRYLSEQQHIAKAWDDWQKAPGEAGEAPPEPSDAYKLCQWAVGWVRDNAGAIGKGAINVGGGALGATVSLISSVGQFVFGAFLTAFFFFFCCTGWGRVLTFWNSLIPERRKGRIVGLVLQMDAVIAGFVRGRLTICGLMIVVYTTGYWLIGVPAPLVVGPIVGILTIVPYAAGAVGIPLSMLLLWLEPSGGFRGEWWWIVGSPLLVTGVVQVLDDYILTPRIQGKTTKMDTPTILFASIAGGALAGFYGILLAIPVAACIKIVLRELFWPRFREWSQGKAQDFLPIGKD